MNRIEIEPKIVSGEVKFLANLIDCILLLNLLTFTLKINFAQYCNKL
jgi:hypothetical protein